ncbi:hypothetical protein [Dolichospermum circinale]|uniref:hypothetical protein n=1 Tax=Dolichospermum circinale TaxID=109265 RepID=UPI0003FA0944|nr:hypothetical protein [Dolichospermum circinale]
MSTKSEKILSEIQNGFWNKKNNLMVTDDVISALSTGNSWLDSRFHIQFAKEELKPLYSLLDYFTEDTEEYHIENIAAEILESSYGVNRAFNSRENKGALDNDDIFVKANYDALLEVNNTILDYEYYANANFSGDKYDIFNKLSEMENSNRAMLLQIWGTLRAAITALLHKLLQIIVNIISSILKTLYDNQKKVEDSLLNVPIIGLSEFYMLISSPVISAIDISLNAAKSLIESMIKNVMENIEGFLLTVLSRIEQFIEIWTSIVNNFVEFVKIIGEVWKFAQKFVQSKDFTPKEKTTIYATVRPQLTAARNEAREIKKQFKLLNEEIKSSRKETRIKSKELVFINDLLKFPRYQNDNLKGLFNPVTASYGAIASVDSPTKVDVANIVKQIAESILSTFVLKGVGIPKDFFDAIKEITASIVLKNLEQSGVDEIKYLVADIFKSVASILPRIFNKLGMFTGAYSVLIACAAYIIAAGAIIMLALEYSKKTKLGDFIVIAGYAKNQQEPDICCAGVDGSDTMKDIDKLINSMYENTFKNYDSLIVMTHDHSFFTKKLCRCFDYTEGKPIILSEEQSKIVDEQIRNLDFMGF